jgi:NADH-quinone oxidoreductase subunit M
MYKRVIFGKLTKDTVKAMPDMSIREFGYFVPLILLVVWLGLYPLPVLDVMHASASHLVDQATGSKLDAAAALAQAMPAVAHH